MEERAVEEEEEKDKDTPASVTGRNCFFLSEKKKENKRDQEESQNRSTSETRSGLESLGGY